MFSKQRLALVVAGLAMSVGGVWVAQANQPPTTVGKEIANFTLMDQSGKEVSLTGAKDAKLTVVVFVGTECPVNNLYMPKLVEMQAKWAPKGVRFLAINSNDHDTAERIRDHAKKNELTFPVLRDAGNAIADRFGAIKTPEAFVLDSNFTVRYQGRIDDQYGIGYIRPRPTQRHLEDALTAVLAGKSVAVASAATEGCKIARVVSTKDSGTITYAKHISRIMQNHCQECHRPEMVGPMSLLTYEHARSWSATIQDVLEDGRMPPWPADPRYGKWANDRSLSAGDRKMVLDWIAQGMPRGEDKDLPAPKKFVDGWKIGQPDVVLKMPKAFQVPAETPKGGVPYTYFTVDTNFTEDKWVLAAEAKPGAPAVVHHIIVTIIPPGQSYKGGQSEGLCGMAPGDMPTKFAPGFGRMIPKGSKLSFQMHYTPNGKAQLDQSMVGIVFAKEAPKYAVKNTGVMNFSFSIPPGADNHKVESSKAITQDCLILGFMPHMHVRGKDFEYSIVYPDGKKEILLSVPRYLFDWQQGYKLAEPLAVPKGSKLLCVAHFDNSTKNLNNPDPTKTVRWGDQTWEEMMIGWTDFAYPLASLKKGE